jgi:hypothetical protein
MAGCSPASAATARDVMIASCSAAYREAIGDRLRCESPFRKAQHIDFAI